MGNLDNNALVKSAGIGAGVILVLTLLQQIPLVGIACCCLALIGLGGVGALYGYFAKQNGAAADAGSFALGGAIAATVAGLVRGIIGAIVTAIFGTAVLADTFAQLQSQGVDVPPELIGTGVGGGAMAVGVISGICLSIVIGAALGAIGGAIYASTAKDKAPAM